MNKEMDYIAAAIRLSNKIELQRLKQSEVNENE
jgi:hypothetical protein